MMTFLIVLALWLLFNELAPLSLLTRARQLKGDQWWRSVRQAIPVKRVSFWATTARYRGSAFTFQCFCWRFVVIDEVLLSQFPGEEVEAIIAHELAHCALGHPRKRWLAIVSGAIFLKPVADWSMRFEIQADGYAMRVVGFKVVDNMRRRLDSWGMARR
jgi:Zn-dependent protease with chaperone function